MDTANVYIVVSTVCLKKSLCRSVLDLRLIKLNDLELSKME
jgi:hypothetical protein